MGVPPHVIADNASAPTKSTPSPNQRAYVGLKKYAMMADLLGPTGHTVEEKAQSLVTATEQLLDLWAFRGRGLRRQSPHAEQKWQCHDRS
jgi:hypothetical protein